MILFVGKAEKYKNDYVYIYNYCHSRLHSQQHFKVRGFLHTIHNHRIFCRLDQQTKSTSGKDKKMNTEPVEVALKMFT